MRTMIILSALFLAACEEYVDPPQQPGDHQPVVEYDYSSPLTEDDGVFFVYRDGINWLFVSQVFTARMGGQQLFLYGEGLGTAEDYTRGIAGQPVDGWTVFAIPAGVDYARITIGTADAYGNVGDGYWWTFDRAHELFPKLMQNNFVAAGYDWDEHNGSSDYVVDLVIYQTPDLYIQGGLAYSDLHGDPYEG